MPLAVIPEIGPRGRVPGAVALGAGRVIVATRHHGDGAVVIVAVIVVAVAVVVVGVVIGAGQCAADHGAGSDARPESAAMAMTPSAVPVTAAPIVAGIDPAARIGRAAD